MTEYEYEYEWLLKQAYRQMILDAANQQKLNTADVSFERQFSMDENEYEAICELADRGEYVDFEIPADAPEGKRMSESVLGIDRSETDSQFPMDLKELFPD